MSYLNIYVLCIVLIDFSVYLFILKDYNKNRLNDDRLTLVGPTRHRSRSEHAKHSPKHPSFGREWLMPLPRAKDGRFRRMRVGGHWGLRRSEIQLLLSKIWQN
jgi:hypothetical protein